MDTPTPTAQPNTQMHDAVMHALHEHETTMHEATHEMTPYTKLILLSEMPERDLCLDECTNAECAMARVLKYGTCDDVAEAIKHYVHFLMNSFHS